MKHVATNRGKVQDVPNFVSLILLTPYNYNNNVNHILLKSF